MRKKQNKEEPPLVATDLSTAIEVFMFNERTVGTLAPPIVTTDFTLEVGLKGGCRVKPHERGYLRDIETHFKELTEIAKKLKPRIKVVLHIYWTTGGHSVAFRGRSSISKTNYHQKTLKTPKELEKWRKSKSSEPKPGSSRELRWECIITRV